MTCPPAIKHSLYADGALPPAEARAIEVHMQTCDRCRAAADRTTTENRALSAAFHSSVDDLPEWTLKPLATPAELLRNAGTTVALLFAPAWLLSRHVPLRFVFPALVGVIEPSQAGVAAFALLLAIGAAASWLGLRRVRGLAMILFFLAMLTPAQAITYRAQGPVALVAAGETVNDSLFATGEIVRVEGVIAGDLYAFARRIEISGAVRGNVYVFGKETEIAGTLGRNLYVWAESTHLGPDARITGKVIAAGESATVAATVGGPLQFYGERLNIEDRARIAGPVTSEVEDERARFHDPWFYARRMVAFAFALLAAFVAARLAPIAVQESVLAVAHWWRSLFTGIAAAVLGPIVILVAAITVIGLPIAAVLIVVLVLAVFFSKVLIGDFAGKILLPGRRPAIQLACGLALIFIAIELPFGIGSAVWTATALVGLGAFTSAMRRHYRGIFR